MFVDSGEVCLHSIDVERGVVERDMAEAELLSVPVHHNTIKLHVHLNKIIIKLDLLNNLPPPFQKKGQIVR